MINLQGSFFCYNSFMKKSNVYFYPVSHSGKNYSKEALAVFEELVEKEHVSLAKELPLKIHPGEPGNISYNKPENYDAIIDFLESKKIKTYFIETNTVTGKRTNKADHLKVIAKHGFTRIPFVIADGEKGTDDISVPIIRGKYFKTVKIAKELANKNQVLVLSHFKGHIAAGFGAAIKMLGIGFASRRGKMEIHTLITPPDDGTIDWNGPNVQPISVFRERMTESAVAASVGKKHIYITYAINLVNDCDCDGFAMKPIYKDLGVFASTDPVAIDKACFDELSRREGKRPFEGDEIFTYAQSLLMGSVKYNLIRVS